MLFSLSKSNKIYSDDKHAFKLEDKEIAHRNEIVDLNKASEETLAQLKALFSTEKVRLEEKLKEEKYFLFTFIGYCCFYTVCGSILCFRI